MTPTATSPQTTLTPDEVRLLEAWQARARAGTFSPAVAGTRTVRVMGRAGDAPVVLPRVASVADLAALAPDERFAIDYGERLVRAFRARGRSVFAGGELVTTLDPTKEHEVLVLSPLAGGARGA